MPQFRVRVVRVRRVVQDGFVTVEAEDKESAIEAAYEAEETRADEIDWRTQDQSTENVEIDEESIQPAEPAQAS